MEIRLIDEVKVIILPPINSGALSITKLKELLLIIFHGYLNDELTDLLEFLEDFEVKYNTSDIIKEVKEVLFYNVLSLNFPIFLMSFFFFSFERYGNLKGCSFIPSSNQG